MRRQVLCALPPCPRLPPALSQRQCQRQTLLSNRPAFVICSLWARSFFEQYMTASTTARTLVLYAALAIAPPFSARSSWRLISGRSGGTMPSIGLVAASDAVGAAGQRPRCEPCRAWRAERSRGPVQYRVKPSHASSGQSLTLGTHGYNGSLRPLVAIQELTGRS